MLPVRQTPMTKPTLVVLAAGMGSRYGGLKQLDPMGPHGETILDYSVFDAQHSGFGRVVFVIRRDFADQFEAQVVARYASRMEVVYVFQDLHDLPAGFRVPSGRTKPWGTVHALLAARQVLDGFFAVVNADDFYGRQAYRCMVDYHRQWCEATCPASQCAMVAYTVQSTLSSHGGVNRGICQVHDGLLVSVEELTDIKVDGDGVCRGRQLSGQTLVLSRQALVSMNFWGMTPWVLTRLSELFTQFLAQQGEDPVSECYIPTVLDTLIRSQQVQCRALPTESDWFGVTYPQDKALCARELRQLIETGSYPPGLWS